MSISLLFAFTLALPAHAARGLQPVNDAARHALVIGNNSYQGVKPLEKAANDARAMGRALDKIGYKTTVLVDANQRQMNAAVNRFVDNIAGGGEGVLFFAGHGVQINNQNYLLPIDIEDPKNEADVADQAVNLQLLQDKIAQVRAQFALLVVDACRDNPLPRKAGRSVGGTRGLAQASSAEGQMVIFSAGANQQALDKLNPQDRDPNGVFTREFLPWLNKPGVSVRQAVQEVRRAVYAKAKSVNHDQFPAVYDQVLGDFYFVPGAAQADAPIAASARPYKPPVQTAPAIDPAEAAYWAEVGKSADPDDYAAYLRAYPSGLHVADANEYLERDKQAKAARARLQEDQAWNTAQSGNSRVSYGGYLKAYPNGRYAPLAQLKFDKLKPAVLEPEMVAIPGRNYEIGKYEVTQAEWQTVMGNNPSRFKGCDTCPVEQVSWNDVQDYLKKLNELTGKQYRLPTEAEWKAACDGGQEQEYCGSGNVDAVAWYDGNSGNKTHPAGQKQANGYGLYDMSGNVWEWMQDCYDGDCSRRVNRGGSWFLTADFARAAYRFRFEPAYRDDLLGFRPARTLP
ncbi:MAG: SUMF1/EgtB/PvdO family nonheme iron enzyme [Pseudomonadota bacterium]|nr:SUMF1/EgtB/PvdO family nonheme iron enzyme [Pseudomonadota bacterium]